ncbi:KpsF/GutQ family sugar-phosphate isomerase [Rhizobium laguerreae]|uniref:KpsF/GutQ family sugar-phosphate isomerase n=1 Tax=Rhizobium laguerreae TaxID=1076926 RepID=UPI001C912330|nr:KpsF/GutQ family sugar-phosphate isomerase [Rhizobium laguerreae]MBY3170265.1 KpsF/GutQ family sugar-phosphate isomerase [Rhizobium laguerreae]MBY3197664.1 KpsF/GutQ family sugar-phosphate isomerase [Rhizobium laguerreae]MBY3231154.1 KpsF/GutQ family sugar-phosphate isomerase [Rhizobium laguerreae]MBY3513753.1 KpsF/GutQ family sugar-phosphate isomerase [Rhizobium laguerreae]MBY3561850.1 KpsF/GutQ family sugar-phosphate isomerase [Rhizobium laguerreae]
MNRRAINLVENSVLESAKRTIETERRGLEALERAFDNGLAGPFTRAVEVIGDISGRVIVTGVGKSGHIGAKLAATFASTGTPAFFVHAAEANHGDLGMIARDDVVLAISKGGESAELKSIISFTRRFSIPLIAITCSEGSSLAAAADIVLLMPNEQEACPNGLAPTTSTLMQLAIGDALAVALLEARGFTATDFHVFHPGGKLGASLMHVGDIMHTGERLPLVATGTPMPEAITVLSRKHFGCVGVLDEDGRLCGIVTEGDMARNLTRNLAELAVDDIMTRTPKTVRSTVLATAALALLNQHHIGALIVIDEDRRPVGLVHFHDLLRIGVA